jgi:hypothetical protein
VNEYTWCPAGCGALVVIYGGNKINFCCKPCWETFWEDALAHMSGEEIPGTAGRPHSEECGRRQKDRRGVEVVLDRTFELKRSGPQAVVDALEEDQN